MDIWEDKQGHVLVLSLKGRLDAATSKALEDKLLLLIDRSERFLVIDYLQLEYISSAGLRVLLMAAKKLKELKGKLVLASLQVHIKEIFEIAGFLSIFQVFEGKENAVKSLT